MSDDTNRKIVKAMLDEVKRETAPLMEAMKESINSLIESYATICGEELNDSNRQFYDCLVAIIFHAGIKEEETAKVIARAVSALARQCERKPADWQRGAMVCGEDQELTTGETLGLGPLLHYKPEVPHHLSRMLAECAEFFAVPAEYREPMARLVTLIQEAHSQGQAARDLPQEWAAIYALVMLAILARCGYREPAALTLDASTGRIPDGAGRWRH